MKDWQDELRAGNFRARELHRANYEQERSVARHTGQAIALSKRGMMGIIIMILMK